MPCGANYFEQSSMINCSWIGCGTSSRRGIEITRVDSASRLTSSQFGTGWDLLTSIASATALRVASVERGAMIPVLPRGDKEMIAAAVDPDFRRRLRRIVKDDGGIDRVREVARETPEDGFRPGPQFVGNVTVTCRDARIHAHLRGFMRFPPDAGAIAPSAPLHHPSSTLPRIVAPACPAAPSVPDHRPVPVSARPGYRGHREAPGIRSRRAVLNRAGPGCPRRARVCRTPPPQRW